MAASVAANAARIRGAPSRLVISTRTRPFGGETWGLAFEYFDIIQDLTFSIAFSVDGIVRGHG